MTLTDRKYAEASIKTANNLRSVATSKQMTQLSPLTLPEIEAVVNVVSDVLPAGNVPGMILSSLVNQPGRRPPPETVSRDINLLYQGLENALDKAVHGAKFAGPAAVLWGYQNLLKLAGKEMEASFPDGLWQFYLDYAFREDTARYTFETHAFDSVLRRHELNIVPTKRVTAWLMAAVQVIHQYHELLTNRWREQVYLALVQQVTHGGPYATLTADLHARWLAIRPLSRGYDAEPSHNYAQYRRVKFDAFLREVLAQLDEHGRYAWNQQVQVAKQQLPTYQRQLSMLAYLEPTAYNESRQPVALKDTCVGLIYQNRYYLLPTCLSGTNQPVSVDVLEAQVHQIISRPTGSAALPLSTLTNIKRKEWANLRPTLNNTLLDSLQALRRAPIIFNADRQASNAPLSSLRRAERGVGDHALTIFDTQRTMLFDASPIFFDTMWAAELSEILTQEALSWAAYLSQTAASEVEIAAPRPLMLPFERSEQIFIQQATKITAEVSAETTSVQLKPLIALQKMFRMRSDLLNLELQDLLVLYRAIHNYTYQPDPNLVSALAGLQNDRKLHEAADGVQTLWQRPLNPGILLPLSAPQSPHERVHPLVFDVPVRGLNLLRLHQDTLAALDAYETAAPQDRLHTYTTFDKQQREYLATLAGFGQILAQAKALAQGGHGRGQQMVRMLATLPPAMKSLFDQLSNRSEVLNNVLKGSEIFEWVDLSGAVNSLTRFNGAKEDSVQKTLIWGALLDTHSTLTLTLRDFRPEIVALAEGGRRQLAMQICEHYLNSYARGLNTYVAALRRITKSSRETQLVPPPH